MPTVLVIEDNEAMQNIVKMILQDVGYKVIQALTIEEAEKAFELHSSEIDVYLIDRNLDDGINTDSLVEKIRKSYPLVPMVAFSGDEDVRKEQIKLGCSHELEKPVGIDKLISFFTSLKNKK